VLDLEADRMSTHYLASKPTVVVGGDAGNLLLERVRDIGCAGTELARATAGGVRLKLLKVAGSCG
jgi:hypothetical protein